MCNCKPMIQFFATSFKHSMAETSNEHYAEVLDRIFRGMEGLGVEMKDHEIVGLDGATLQEWFNRYCDNHKPSTVNNTVIILNKFLHWASTMSKKVDGVKVPYIDDDYSNILHTIPIPDIDELPPEERPKDKYYTEEQVQELLWGNHGRNQVRDRAIMGLILFTGLRVSEVCSLTIGNFLDSPHGIMTVKRKGGKYCSVKVADQVYDLVNHYLELRDDKDDHSRPLFVTTHGNPCNRKQLYDVIAFKQREMGLATGPHAIRHTAISQIGNMFGATVAREFANHKSIKITNRYSHTTDSQMVNAVNNLPWRCEA